MADFPFFKKNDNKEEEIRNNEDNLDIDEQLYGTETGNSSFMKKYMKSFIWLGALLVVIIVIVIVFFISSKKNNDGVVEADMNAYKDMPAEENKTGNTAENNANSDTIQAFLQQQDKGGDSTAMPAPAQSIPADQLANERSNDKLSQMPVAPAPAPQAQAPQTQTKPQAQPSQPQANAMQAQDTAVVDSPKEPKPVKQKPKKAEAKDTKKKATAKAAKDKAKATSKANAKSSAKGGWVVQLAALSTKAKANQSIKEFKSKHADLVAGKTLFVAEGKAGEKKIYRVRVKSFKDSEAAGEFCSSLKAQNLNCTIAKN